MPRDYKKSSPGASKPAASAKKSTKVTAAKPKPPTEKGVSPVLSMSLGLGIGLTVAAYVYFVSMPTSIEKELPEIPVVVKAPVVDEKKEIIEEREEEGARFDFYSILPKLEVVIPEQDIYEQKKVLSNGLIQKTIKPIEKPGRYLLQVGSFRKIADAERVKAELAFLGIESYIEPVALDDSSTWYRVRVGPFDENKQLDKVRNRLLDNHVEVMVLKVKAS